jgi:hypothetical protein
LCGNGDANKNRCSHYQCFSHGECCFGGLNLRLR